ncbi:MAG: restriction endonuclease subunit S [Gammaproteobacteria bacterium]|nr:restriction endonuclease subunit S [Gammaproteobacteria bacterium]MCY4255829.1 restriction endonuclease subunit S [Gammaproteobacteria bacterium]
MTRYPQVPLGDICTVNPRAGKTACLDDTSVSFVPMAAVDESAGEIAVRQQRPFAEVAKSYTSFEDGDILFAKITPCMENGKVALARNLANGIGRGSTEFHVLRPGERALGEYIYHFVRQPGFREEAKRNFTGTAGQQRVPKQFMQNASIPLPSLDEQRRIVAILNRAAKIERLKKQAQERLREFIPALFVKMFGDPAKNPMEWPREPLGEVCDIVGGGTPRRRNPAYFGGLIPWARPTDVTALAGFCIEATEERITDIGLRESSARMVPAGTVLLTSRATIGHTAIAAKPMATNQGFANLMCGQRLLPEYLAYWLRLRRDHLIQLSGGSTFKEISKSTLKKVEIPVPPIDLQRRYARLAEATQSMISMERQGFSADKALSASLISRLLSGNTGNQ